MEGEVNGDQSVSNSTQHTLILRHHHCVFFNHHDCCVAIEYRGTKVDAWQLGVMLTAVIEVRDDNGLD